MLMASESRNNMYIVKYVKGSKGARYHDWIKTLFFH